jgi:hypothetical protein
MRLRTFKKRRPQRHVLCPRDGPIAGIQILHRFADKNGSTAELNPAVEPQMRERKLRASVQFLFLRGDVVDGD